MTMYFFQKKNQDDSEDEAEDAGPVVKQSGFALLMADDSDADKASSGSGDDHVAQPVKKQNKKKVNKKSSFQQMAELDDEQLSGADSDGTVTLIELL